MIPRDDPLNHALATRLARAEMELGELRQQLPRPKRNQRGLGFLGLSLGSAILAAARLGIADSPALAGEVVPRQIPYRGVLQRDGVPVTNSATAMRFRLYESATSTTMLWEEQRAVPVVAGNFSVDLGDVTPISSELLRLPALYVSVEVDGQTLSGRQRLMSVPYAQRAGDGTPPGVVNAFAGATPPSGWLLCDGHGVSKAQYPGLFAAIGTSWGNGSEGCATGATCDFNVPDLRGRFLRGVDASAARDPDRATRAASRAGGNLGDAVGSAQGPATALPTVPWTTNETPAHNHAPDAIYNHLVAMCRGTPGHETHSISTATDGAYPDGFDEVDVLDSGHIRDAGEHSHSLGGGDLETRPANGYVNWIIRY